MNRDPIRLAVIRKAAQALLHAGEAQNLANASYAPLDAEGAERIALILDQSIAAAEAARLALAPLWEAQTEHRLTEQQRSVLDLDSWSSTEGITSLQAVRCPFCKRECETPETLKINDVVCRHCGASFFLERIATPVGLAWSTWKQNPRTLTKGA